MGRIVVNKHFDVKSQITPEKFANKGEIVISNQVGYEGIFIVNKNNEIVYIGPTSGSGADVSVEYKEYLDKVLQEYYTSEQTINAINEALSSVTIDNKIIEEIVDSALTESLGEYIKIDEISAYTLSREDVKVISAEEVAKIVDSADTRFDTLKEIADWIINDTLGAAQMANDINNLKAISADTRIEAMESISANTRIEILEGSSHTHDNKEVIDGITSEDISSWNNSEENAKAYASAYTQSALTNYATKEYVDRAGGAPHVFLSSSQYETLIAEGSVIIGEETIVYDDNTYYAIYEDVE